MNKFIKEKQENMAHPNAYVMYVKEVEQSLVLYSRYSSSQLHGVLIFVCIFLAQKK